MKRPPTMCFLLLAFALTAGAAVGDPSINYNASKSNTGNLAAGDVATCPDGKIATTNAVTGQKSCPTPEKSVNYNSSKSNTGNLAEGSNTDAHAGHPASSARYHCGKGEYMLQNGDCVPNPPSKPND